MEGWASAHRPLYNPLMAKHATANVEDGNATMERRKHLAGLIRARMAKTATAAENQLWQELKAEVENERLTFRS